MDVGQSLRRAAQINPGGISVVFGNRRRSWAETALRVARLAGGLRRIGFAPGDRAAILALNSDRYFEYNIAVPSLGGLIVPLNIRLAARELADILDDCQPRLLFIDTHFLAMLDRLPGRTGRFSAVIFLDDGVPPTGTCSYEDLLEAPAVSDAVTANDDPAAIMYTGGTTGRPKGVVLSHRNLVVNAANFIVAQGFTRDTIYLHAPPMFHAAGQACILCITMLGARHVIIPRFDPSAVAGAIARERATASIMVPTMINALVNYPGIREYDLTSMVTIPFGASPMPDAVLTRAREVMPWCTFMHVYGMTEAAPLVTALDRSDAHTNSRSCGRAVALVEVRIADADDREVPRGTVGEVQVRGPNVMLGYWNRPEQTAAALHGGWYHTGDGGYMDEQGFVYIVDRLKDMIISGGENIYSAEVENAIATLDGVREVAVIGIPDERWGETVHAVVVPREGVVLTAEQLTAHCRTQIAGYKCPRSVEIRSEPLPLSGAGKVLKTVLREPFWRGRERRVG